MRIALTTTGRDLGAPLDVRFGRAAAFALVDDATKAFSILDNAFAVSAQGAGVRAAETVVKAGASVVITGDCGPKAFSALKQAGVRVYSCKGQTVEAALALFAAGKLEEITAA